jgi:RNA 3'-terminal phosphate cyclase (ATP)
MADTLVIDGARGEGGGQVLRTSLSLAAITGRTIRIDNIRARRAKPGLQRQHLTCVKAAAAICDAELRGAQVGSGRVDFAPQAVRAGDYTFDIGSAGGTGLVLQTVIPILLGAPGPSTVTVIGGTHNPMAPCFDFLARAFAPILARMGGGLTLAIERHGFYPAGGGRVTCAITPASWRSIALCDRGPVTRRAARVILARLPTHVGDRELAVVQARLGWAPDECAVVATEAVSSGNALLLEVERGGVVELITGFGEKGVRAELVAERACDELAATLAADAPVGPHLADQLLLPMALAARAGAGRSGLRTGPLTLHPTTNLDTIGLFLGVPRRTAEDGGAVEIAIG